MKLWRVVVAIAAVGILVGGCGGGSDTKTGPDLSFLRGLYVELEGYPGPENVGIPMAEKRGFFADENLSMEIYTPGDPAFAIHYALAGASQLALTSEPQLVMAQAKGMPIVAVGSLVSQPTAAVIWLKDSHIGNVANLKGKTIAIEGLGFQKAFLEAILSRAGLTLPDVKVRSVGYGLLSALKNGQADAILGSGNVEGAELEAQGLQPVVTPVQDLGVPEYDELMVVAPRARLADEGQEVREFMSAVDRGAAAASEDPAGAVQAIKTVGEPKPEFSRKPTEAAVETTLPLLAKTERVSPAKARALVDWMYREGMIQRKPPVSKLLTDDYLPGS
jgi:putative hydroxymethylpyrimidine transport system substrate-binding protein